MRVYKYPLPEPNDYVQLEMPAGAQILTVQLQSMISPRGVHEKWPCVWALVDPGAIMVLRELRLAGTGHDILTGAWPYIGTFQMSLLVFHLFDCGERS